MDLNLDWRRRQSAVWPQVSYELRPLRVWAFQELLACWADAEGSPASGGEGGAQDAGRAAGLVRTARLMDVARRILPDHVRGLEGLRVRGEGGPAEPSMEALCEEALLMPLAAELVERLVEISALEPGAEKN